jgi:hypothetical protein
MKLSLLKIFNPAFDVRAGLAITGGEFHYILLAKKAGKTPEVLLKKKGLVSSLKIPFSLPVHSVLPNIPSLLIRDEFAPHTPEEWIDQNEAKVIPRGIASHEIINEWCVENETIFSGTISKKSFQKAMELIPHHKFIMASLSLSLWDLSILYSAYFPGPFVIWKLWSDASVIAYVDKGKLCGVADFWAGTGDIEAKGHEIQEEFQSVVRSLLHSEEKPNIVVVAGGKAEAVSEFIKNSGCVSLNLPVIKNVPPEFQEAYAAALHEDTTLDFAPIEQVQNARQLANSRTKTLKLFQAAFIFLAIFLAGLFLLKGSAMIADRYVAKKLSPVQKYFGEYKSQQARLDNLSAQLQKKTQFVSQKSAMTFPLTEFQSAFPEGVWAEEISFTENGLDSWICAIIAYSNSSEAIPSLIANVSAIRGMNDVRMIYSEQIAAKGKSGEHAIKFRVEAVWKNRI